MENNMETIKIVSKTERGYTSESEVHFDGQVWRWGSNGRIPPKDAIQEYAIDMLPGYDEAVTEATRKAEDAAWLENYRKDAEAAAARLLEDPERLGEMKNAFGEGAKVVNVITGKVTQL
jgi:hypothetical protein